MEKMQMFLWKSALSCVYVYYLPTSKLIELNSLEIKLSRYTAADVERRQSTHKFDMLTSPDSPNILLALVIHWNILAKLAF